MRPHAQRQHTPGTCGAKWRLLGALLTMQGALAAAAHARAPVATRTQVSPARNLSTAASRAGTPWSAEMLPARTPSASSCLPLVAQLKP